MENISANPEPSNQELRDEITTLQKKLEEYKKLYLAMLERCKALERGILFQGRERLLEHDSVTLSLLDLLLKKEPAAEPTPPSPPVPPPAPPPADKPPRPKPTGRKPLPAELPRVDIDVVPLEVQQKGLERFERIGEDLTEVVEHRPASLVVLAIHKGKFIERSAPPAAASDTAIQIHQAQTPELPIPGGLAGPALLADTLVKRWEDHLPLHRLERIYGREKLELPRSTVCNWHHDLWRLARPLLAAMWLDALQSPYLCADATGVLVQEEKKCRRGHFFVVAAPERHVLFGYSPEHNSVAVDKLLKDYKGYLVADAHTVYDHLYRSGNVIECGCWAHTRRYFFKSLETDPERAKYAIELIGKLFELERQFATGPPEQRLAERQRNSASIVDAFFAWCEGESTRVLDETPISKALQYARNQQVPLRRFLENGKIPIHNNLSERELRREAVGRKNWLFLGSDQGGEVNATFVSLIASCRHHGIDPAPYLRDLFCLLPAWSVTRALELSPLNWKATSQREEVQQLLAANVYRRVSLGGDK
jgi:transposase